MLVNLVSWEHCKKLLEIDSKEKAFIELLIFSATAEIETYTGRKLKQREIRELHDGCNQIDVILKQYPLKEVISLKVDSKRNYPEDTIINADYYTCFIPYADDDMESQSEIILAEGYRFPKGRNNIEIIYSAGYTEEEIPEDLKTAVTELVEWNYKRLKNRQIGEVNLKYGQKTQLETTIPQHIEDLIEPYKRKNW
jgi:hypothetical protein